MSLADKVAALCRDFGLPESEPIPAVAAHACARLGLTGLENAPLAARIEACYKLMHELDAPAPPPSATASGAPAVVQGVLLNGPQSLVAQPTPAVAVAPNDPRVPFAVGRPVSDDGGGGNLGSSTTVARALGAAIGLGAPAYNRGDHEGCYRLYRATCQALVLHVADEEVKSVLDAALDRAASEAADGLYRVPPGSFTRGAWTLRRAMDGLEENGRWGSLPVIGMPAVSDLWSELCRDRAELSLGPLRAGALAGGGGGGGGGTGGGVGVGVGGVGGISMKEAIKGAISLGAPAYNRGNKAACYYIYRRTAEEMIKCLDAGVPSSVLSSVLLRSRALELERRDGGDAAAWALRRCFDGLLLARENPSLGRAMPSARLLWAEPSRPRGGEAEASSCCVLA